MYDESLVMPGERVDDLQLKGLKLIQDPKAFCFGTDAVLLADFTTVKKNEKICDLGTGTGILPLLLYGRHPFDYCAAVEIQPQAAERAARNMRYNGLEEKVSVFCNDLRRVKEFLPSCAFGTVICNPPYKKENAGEKNQTANKAISRHEETCKPEDICAAAAYLLKNGGHLALIQHSDRIVDLFEVMRRYGIEPKRCRCVQSRPTTPPYVVLIEGVKEGKPYMHWEPALIMYRDDGSLNPEMDRIYHREESKCCTSVQPPSEI